MPTEITIQFVNFSNFNHEVLIMFRRSIAITFVTLLSTLCTTVYAQRANSDGDYKSADDGQGYHIRWEVKTDRLNCRKSPGDKQQVLQQYVKGDLLTADTNDGSSNPILMDADSKPWLRVKLAGGNLCYVRARNLYINPLKSGK
jgi:hypothetical protein